MLNIPDEKNLVDQVITESSDLLALNLGCYCITKNRLFGPAIKEALDKLAERTGTF
jgi:hypothetical protein